MKKTLIAIFSMASVVYADGLTLDDATIMSGGSFTAPTTWTTSGLSVTLTFDVDALKTLVSSVNSSNRPVILSMVDTGSNSRGVKLGETSTATALVALANGNNPYGEWVPFTVGDWDKVDGAALTFTAINGGAGSVAVLTFLSEGTYSNYEVERTGLMWSSGGDMATVTYNSNIVETAYAWDGNSINGEEMNKAAIAASIPEPTTATLSLLALAGLAARRRRASR